MTAESEYSKGYSTNYSADWLCSFKNRHGSKAHKSRVESAEADSHEAILALPELSSLARQLRERNV